MAAFSLRFTGLYCAKLPDNGGAEYCGAVHEGCAKPISVVFDQCNKNGIPPTVA
jgi:hypothetical protein